MWGEAVRYPAQRSLNILQPSVAHCKDEQLSSKYQRQPTAAKPTRKERKAGTQAKKQLKRNSKSIFHGLILGSGTHEKGIFSRNKQD